CFYLSYSTTILLICILFFFHGTSTTSIYTLSYTTLFRSDRQALGKITRDGVFLEELEHNPAKYLPEIDATKLGGEVLRGIVLQLDRKSTRLNSSHDQISYAVFCLKKKKKQNTRRKDK